jgi:hypothetical protein
VPLFIPHPTLVTSPHPRPPSLVHPSSIVVGIGFVLPVTSVIDSVLPRLFYINDVLVAPDLIQSLLSVHRFTTNNSCSMEFDPFGLSVKDLPTRRVLARYNSTGPHYILPLPTSTTLPRVLSPTPWLPLLPPPPGIVTLATPAPMSTLSCRVAHLSLALGEKMIPCAMPTSLVGTSGCPFLTPLLELFSYLIFYTVTFGPPMF